MEKELLYHYTSIETLALILKNKTICFNNLLNVDDTEESESSDLVNFGKYINVSCWTPDKEESIPLWNLYTPKMKGVRVGLPQFPFKKYLFKAGQYGLTEDTATYINQEWVYNSNIGAITLDMPTLLKVEYTDDEEKIYPTVRNCDDILTLREVIATGNMCGKNFNVTYSYEDVGKYKRSNWSFQNEWRYLIKSSPLSPKDNPTFNSHIEVVRRIEDTESPAPYDKIFLEIDEIFLDEMEILIGPNCSEADKIIINSLISQYAPKATIRDSNLKIRKYTV